jgi:fructose-bisphosphate aldolase class I
MTTGELEATAKMLVRGDKGLLAMDESSPTCNARFAPYGISQTAEARRAYRELIVTTPGLLRAVFAHLYTRVWRSSPVARQASSHRPA